MEHKNDVSWISLATIWLGGMVSVPSLLIGSTLVNGLGFYQAIIAGLLGITFVTMFMCFESVAAAIEKLNTVQLARSAFGTKGSAILIGSIIGLATMGWFGVQTNIAGMSFSKILLDTFSMNIPVTVSSILWGVIMLITAVYGFTLMKWLNYVAVPAISVLLIYGLYISFAENGWASISDFEPDQPISMLSAIGLTIGFISVGGVISPDINRFAKTSRDAVLGSVLGVIPAGILLIAVGAILSILQSTHDITEIFANLGYPILALSILILATWTTNVVNAYSGGLALNQLLFLPESKRPISTLIAGLIGTALAAMGILNHFIGFLTILTTAIPPIAGVIISDYWFSKTFINDEYSPIQWEGFFAWSTGVFIMIFMNNPIKNLLSIFVAAFVFYILQLLKSKRTVA